MGPVANWYLTFGVQYAREPHPFGPKGGNPNGFVTVKAQSEAEARDQVMGLIGTKWSMLYSESEFVEAEPEGTRTVDYFPDGCSGVILDGKFTLTSELSSPI